MTRRDWYETFGEWPDEPECRDCNDTGTVYECHAPGPEYDPRYVTAAPCECGRGNGEEDPGDE